MVRLAEAQIMNPTNQQPYYNYQQHTPGPPQPQWQAPTKQGWGDPRISSPVINSPAASFPPPPPPPPPQGYGRGSNQPSGPWPPPPPAPGYPNVPYQDTATWGVKYNQAQPYTQQDNALKPSLPPRPLSGLAGASTQPAWSGQFTDQRPPTPPPRPVEYAVPQQQAQNDYYPHEQYSNRPSSHYYQPGGQPQGQNPTPSWQSTSIKHDDPVSPIDNHPTWQTSTPAPQPYHQPYGQPHPSRPTSTIGYPPPTSVGASALGTGGPSDWEHFSGDHVSYDGTSPTSRPPHQSTQSPPPPHLQQQYQQSQYPPHQQPQQSQQQQSLPPPPPPLQQQQQLYQQQQHGRQQSLAYAVTPEQAHSTPTYSNSTKPTIQKAASPPPPQPPTSHQGPRTPTPPHHHNVSTPHLNDAEYLGSTRPRLDGDTSSVTPGLKRSGTIDSVINAWNTPTLASKADPPKATSRPTSTGPDRFQRAREVATSQTQTDFPPIVKTEIKEVVKVETREVDPYEDLKDEYRTSLNRYAGMLRQEKAAVSEHDKMMVVFEFVNREVSLRSVLFKTESAELVRTSELLALRHAAEELKVGRAATAAAASSAISAKQSVPREPRPETKTYVNTDIASSQHSRDESFVVIGSNGEEDDYSPGGRPRVSTMNRIPAQQRSITPAIQTGPPRTTSAANQRAPQMHSPGADAPIPLDDYAMPDRSFNTTPAHVQRPGSTAPLPPSKPPGEVVPIPFQPARPAYTPFRYTESQQMPQTVVSGSNPANMAYTKMRHEQATDSGRILGQEIPSLTVTAPDRNQSATPSRARQQQEEAFIGLLRQQSKAVRPTRTGTPDAPAPLRAGTPMANRRPSLPPLMKSSESLRQYLPDKISELNFASRTHPKLAPVSQAMAIISDDFGFIHATVVGWDRENRKMRQRLDAERTDRESESQSNIDNLFHDNEIGYHDIAVLEEEFKLEEAAKKYAEDQSELDSFSTDVYGKITQRLEGEVAELERSRTKILEVLDYESQSSSQRIRTALRSPSNALDKAPLADAMTKAFIIFNKIEVRQQKIAEANFEHERRRKRLELSVLFTNGDKEGVKKLEKDFDRAQCMQVLSQAQQRDERANRLMDSFDRAAVGGLAENQSWIDEMSNKAVLLRDLVLGSATNGPQGQERDDLLYGPRGIRESMELLQEAISLVSADSRELVQMSTQADRALNEADFAMFLAEAKIAHADEKEYEKLKGEKAKEDQKLKDESDGRMNGIQRGPDEILGLIKDVRGFIGEDQGHQDRINHALEAAKRRNLSLTGQESIGGA